MATNDVAVDLATAVGQSLPPAYLAFLDGLSTRPTLGEGYGPILDFGGQQWRPHTRTRLADIVPHRRRDSAFPYAHETARHAELLRAADAARGGEALEALVEQGFTFYHDGMEVEQWAPTLAELVAGSRDWLGDEDAEPGAAADSGGK